MPDANKTDLTRQITSAAATWLDERGFKPIETEVSIADKWVADLAGFCYPTRIEAQQLKLVGKKPRLAKADYTPSMTDDTPLKQWEREYLGSPAPLTAVVEVKVSASDFRKDTKWKRAAPAHLLYLAVPPNLIDLAVAQAGVQERWGALVLNAAGALRQWCSPHVNEVAVEQTLRMVCAIAMRRDNVTRYSRFRELQKEAREADNDRINRNRLSSAVEVVLAILDGKPVAEALRMHCYRDGKLPKWQMERLELLSQKAAELTGSDRRGV